MYIANPQLAQFEDIAQSVQFIRTASKAERIQCLADGLIAAGLLRETDFPDALARSEQLHGLIVQAQDAALPLADLLAARFGIKH